MVAFGQLIPRYFIPDLIPAVSNAPSGSDLASAAIPRPGCRQLVIFCADSSFSMKDAAPVGGTKAAAVSEGIHATLARLNASTGNANFYYAYVTFHDSATVRIPVARVASFDATVTNPSSFDPTIGGTGGTRIRAGLEQAGLIARDFRSDTSSGLLASVLVVLLSDGECLEAEQSILEASRLRDAGVTVLAVSFSTDRQSEAAMQACATRPEFFRRAFDRDLWFI